MNGSEFAVLVGCAARREQITSSCPDEDEDGWGVEMSWVQASGHMKRMSIS